MDGLGVQITLGQPDVAPERMIDICLALASSELVRCELGEPGECRMHPREGWLGRGSRACPGRRRALSPAANSCRREPGWRSVRCWPAAARPTPPGNSTGPPLPRQDKPVKWPVYTDNRAIASGLEPEKGATLQLYNWVAYINEAVVKDFWKKYNCNCQVTTFNTMEEALSKLASGELKFDVFFPTVAVLGQLIAAKQIRPLNHSYIPNIANAWPDYLNPFYDRGWQYTTPYSIYTTGMAWRKDKVNLAPSWNMPWQGARTRARSRCSTTTASRSASRCCTRAT